MSKLRELRAKIFPAHQGRTYGVLGEFSDPGALLEAARGVREDGYRYFDTYSPFPIHGMDRAMGLGQSILGYIVLGGGLTGTFLAWLMQWWMGLDYPIIVGGKPFFAIEPSVPIIFEVMVLFSALAALAGMLALNGLPKPYNPLFNSERFARATDDGFFLHIEARDPAFDLEEARDLLTRLGASHTEVIEDYEAEDAPAEAPVSAEG